MLVEAYDQRTGRKYLVRPEAVGHPVVGPTLALTPPPPAPVQEPASTPPAVSAPAPVVVTEPAKTTTGKTSKSPDGEKE